jgi:hypothetical protein
LRPEALAAALAALLITVSCGTGSGSVAKIQSPAKAPGAAVAGEFAFDASNRKVAFRRVTESQYRHAIADVFGRDVTINARFEPEQRQDGLQAIGNSQLSITTTGLEQYVAVARAISDQVLSEENRDRIVGCKPAAPGAADAACAETFIKARGRQLFRRPLTREEIDRRMAIWKAGAEQSGDFHKGLRLSLSSLLMAPEFLFRVERAEPDPSRAGQQRLDGYTKAARLSYLFWDTAPDEELLQVAHTGEIHTPAGLQKQIDRLTASPRLEDGVRAFFVDMLHFEAFDALTKDGQTYPRFSQAVADSAREETIRFLVDHLVTQERDYRDIFTSKETFINRPLAAMYDVAYPSSEPWTRYKFADNSERSGVLTQVTFLSLFSHPGRSSPTVRGVKLHEIFMCVKVPDPPPDVDFSKVQAIEKGTVRTRLIDHMTNPGCSTCHKLSDPAGLMLERFDGAGQFRIAENNQPIDVTGEFNGKHYQGATGLGQYLRDSPLVPACFVKNVYYYGQGRPVDYKEQAYLTQQTEAFQQSGYRLRDLYRRIASSPEFFKVVESSPAPAGSSGSASGAQVSSGGSQ